MEKDGESKGKAGGDFVDLRYFVRYFTKLRLEVVAGTQTAWYKTGSKRSTKLAGLLEIGSCRILSSGLIGSYTLLRVGELCARRGSLSEMATMLAARRLAAGTGARLLSFARSSPSL
eukprot:819692-Rhodomonas_salina.1